MFIKEETIPSNDFDLNILETSIGGLDDRPFDVDLYLNSPFEFDFYTALEASQSPIKSSETPIL